MVEDPPLDILDRASVSLARERIRRVAGEAGFSVTAVEKLALAVSELAQNQLDHAREGQISYSRIARSGVEGVEIVAVDRGPGIADLAGVLDGTVRGRGLSAGLLTTRRIAEEMDADVRHNEGTLLRIRCFVAQVPRHPEVAVFGKGVEPRSGDHAVVERTGEVVVAAVIDGAGHGEPARSVSEIAAAEVRPDRSPAAILDAMHHVLRRTRGASATVVRLDLSRGEISAAGVGNVLLRVTAPTGDVVPRIHPGLLGNRTPQLREICLPFPPRSVACLFTDGISARAATGVVGGRSAIHIGQHLFAAHRKEHDDALVLVVR